MGRWLAGRQLLQPVLFPPSGRIGAVFVRAAEQVVDTGRVIVRKADEHGRGDVQIAQLIVGIGGLMDVQVCGELRLRQVAVLPQVADARKPGWTFLLRGVMVIIME